MTDNVKVKPSTDTSAVRVATDEVDNVHYPIYKLAKGADGEAALITEDNRFPVDIKSAPGETNYLEEIVHGQNELILQMKKLNYYLGEALGEHIKREDIENAD